MWIALTGGLLCFPLAFITVLLESKGAGRAFVASHITMLHPPGKSQASDDYLL